MRRLGSVDARLRQRGTLLGVIIITGLAVRVFAAVMLPDQTTALPDSIAYREAGYSLWTTGQLGTPFHMPLYPALIGVLGPGWRQIAPFHRNHMAAVRIVQGDF